MLTPRFRAGAGGHAMTEKLTWFLEHRLWPQPGRNQSGHNFGLVDSFDMVVVLSTAPQASCKPKERLPRRTMTRHAL